MEGEPHRSPCYSLFHNSAALSSQDLIFQFLFFLLIWLGLVFFFFHRKVSSVKVEMCLFFKVYFPRIYDSAGTEQILKKYLLGELTKSKKGTYYLMMYLISSVAQQAHSKPKVSKHFR